MITIAEDVMLLGKPLYVDWDVWKAELLAKGMRCSDPLEFAFFLDGANWRRENIGGILRYRNVSNGKLVAVNAWIAQTWLNPLGEFLIDETGVGI